MDLSPTSSRETIDWQSVLTNYTERQKIHIPELPGPDWFHVFFIYKTVSPDKDKVKELFKDLTTLGCKCGTHESDYKPGKSIVDNVTDCLQKTLTLIILFSKEFYHSEWCKYDLNVAQTLKNRGQKLHIIPLLLDDCSVPASISHITYLDISISFEKWHGRLIRSVCEGLYVEEERLTRSASTSSICQYCERNIEVSIKYKEECKKIKTNGDSIDVAVNREEVQFQFKEEERFRERDLETSRPEQDQIESTLGYEIKQEAFGLFTLKYPEFVLLQSRLTTFQNYKGTDRHFPDARKMAISGFFFSGNEDAVRCFQCGTGLKNWTQEDDPEFEHARWSPTCPYIIALKGKKYIDLVGEVIEEVEREAEIEKRKILIGNEFSSCLQLSESLSASKQDLGGMFDAEKKTERILDFGSGGLRMSTMDSGVGSNFGSVESLTDKFQYL